MNSECPPEFYECYTEEQFNEILDLFEENEIVMPETLEPLGDVEAASYKLWLGSSFFITMGTCVHSIAYVCTCILWTIYLYSL